VPRFGAIFIVTRAAPRSPGDEDDPGEAAAVNETPRGFSPDGSPGLALALVVVDDADDVAGLNDTARGFSPAGKSGFGPLGNSGGGDADVVVTGEVAESVMSEEMLVLDLEDEVEEGDMLGGEELCSPSEVTLGGAWGAGLQYTKIVLLR